MTMPRALRALTKDRESGWTFTLLLCIPYLVLLIWMHIHHEMWRDEVHPWAMARHAQGFLDLVTGDRMYEGHPPLWFWYLHVWSWFVKSAWGIQVATITAASAAAVILARFAPFPRYLKVLILFSYYFGFEYSVMSRNYVLGWLLVCAFCALYHPLRVRHFAVAIVLALLSLTSFYGLVLSSSLLLFFVLDQLTISRSRQASSPPATITITTSPRTFAVVAIVALTSLFCVLTLEPPDPNPFSPGFNFSALSLAEVPGMLYRLTAGFLPWRPLSMSEFWAMAYTLWDQKSAWGQCFGAGVLACTLAALYPAWRLMLAYLAAVAAMAVFQVVRLQGGSRHWGHFLMLFLALSWLQRTAFPRRRHGFSTAFLVLVFAFQVESFVVATLIDTREVFSGGRDAAAFIRKQGLQDLPFVAGPDYMAASVAVYLDRPFVAAETEEIGESVVFHSRRRPFSGDELMNKAIRLARERKSAVLLVSSQPLPAPPPGVTRAQLFTSRPGTVGDETFMVYRLQAE